MQCETTILLSDVVCEAAHALLGEVDDYDPLLQMIGDAHTWSTLMKHAPSSRSSELRMGDW